jgi:Flp pilus assembly protein TadD
MTDPPAESRDLALPDALELVRGRLRDGRAADAEAISRQILDQLPDQPDALFLHAAACRAQGKRDAAIAALRHLLSRRPEALPAVLELGVLLVETGRLDEAIAHYGAAATRFPGSPDCAFNHGVALLKHGEAEAAAERFRGLCVAHPEFAGANKGLGSALRTLGRLDEAEAALRAALAAAPGDAESHIALGNVLRDGGRLDAALAAFEAALKLDSDNVTARYNRSLALLAAGDLGTGFAEYEAARFAQYEADPARFPGKGRLPVTQPPWDGGALEGRILLLHTEQGAGDAIQFARYIPLLAGRGAERVVLLCPPTLERLFAPLSGVDAVVTALPRDLAFDCHASLVSLPALFGTTLETVPAEMPYLRPPTDAPFALDAPAGALKVGLVWSGSVTYAYNPRRRCALDDLAPLLDCPGTAFFSLQKGPPADDLASSPLKDRIVDLGPRLTDFAATAAAIAALDLVIGTDTSVPHLAGALGKPVFLLLSDPADWRWLQARDDSPWYPTMQLFRQPEPDNWAEATARVRAALDKRLSGKP